jgi:pimeloyl-ACP methyl ester carboxylesterase
MLEVIRRIPEQPGSHPPLLFVHGILHGAWCYDTFWLPYFARHGYDARALSLRGHAGSPMPPGQRLRFTSVRRYVEDVASVAAQIEQETGRRPVVIGHSMGGLIVQKYLETHAAPAAVLVASDPAHGALLALLRVIRRYPLAVLRSTLRMSYYRDLTQNPEVVRWMFFSASMPADTLEAYRRQLGDESFRAILDLALLCLPAPRRVPRLPMLVLAGADDTLFSVQEEQRTAHAYNAAFVAMPGTAHDLMLEANWQQAADHILEFLKEKQL